jgi:hypothetical protein
MHIYGHLGFKMVWNKRDQGPFSTPFHLEQRREPKGANETSDKREVKKDGKKP